MCDMFRCCAGPADTGAEVVFLAPSDDESKTLLNPQLVFVPPSEDPKPSAEDADSEEEDAKERPPVVTQKSNRAIGKLMIGETGSTAGMSSLGSEDRSPCRSAAGMQNSASAQSGPSRARGSAVPGARPRRGSVEIIRQTVTKGIRAFASRMSTAAARLVGLNEASSQELPSVTVPKNKAPIAVQSLEGLTIAQVRRAVQGEKGGCMAAFLAEAMDCCDFEADQWSLHPQGIYVGHMSYTMPAPKDIPDSAKRIVTIPKEMPCTTDTWFANESDEVLVMLIRTKASGVMYSDRIHLEYVYEFKVDGSGGLTTRLWAETVWSKPLPWTHSWISKAVEKRVVSDSSSRFGMFLRQIQAWATKEQADRAERELTIG